jgi:hypothetical protein
MKRSVFWDITSCNPFKVIRRFGGICNLHLQGRRIRQARNQLEADSKKCQNSKLLRIQKEAKPLKNKIIKHGH